MAFGEKLRELRNKSGMTQRELADLLHVSFQTVSKWESGINEPDFSTLKELAKVLSTTTSELLDEADSTNAVVSTDEVIGNCDKCGKAIGKKSKVHRSEKTSPSGFKETVLICDECFNQHEKYIAERTKEINKSVREETAKKKVALARRSDRNALIGGITAAVVSLIAILIACIVNYAEVGLLWTILAPLLGGYVVVSTVFCLFSKTYISDVFLEIGSWSIKFPGLIFSFDLDGLLWFIAMKLLFALLSFFISLGVILLALSISALLSVFSFVPILIYKRANH